MKNIIVVPRILKEFGNLVFLEKEYYLVIKNCATKNSVFTPSEKGRPDLRRKRGLYAGTPLEISQEILGNQQETSRFSS